MRFIKLELGHCRKEVVGCARAGADTEPPPPKDHSREVPSTFCLAFQAQNNGILPAVFYSISIVTCTLPSFALGYPIQLLMVLSHSRGVPLGWI